MSARKTFPKPAPATRPPPTGREAAWEGEGGALRPLAQTPFDPVQQPRLYADLLAEADRRRQAADDKILRAIIAPRLGGL